MRVLYGLERLPHSVDASHLPGVELGAAALRLNSMPVPPVVLAGVGTGHAGRMSAVRAWLHAGCGDYGRARRRWVDAYLGWAELALAGATGLERFRGVYAVEDWVWSAPRPLPRAWVPGATGFVDFALWDGATLTAVCLGAAPGGLGGARVVGADWRPQGSFWHGETVPRSPFRRADLLVRSGGPP